MKNLLKENCEARYEFENIMSDCDCIIRESPLHSKYKGITINRHGKYAILINESLTKSEKYKALEHEISHIVNNDFVDDKSIDEKERD